MARIVRSEAERTRLLVAYKASGLSAGAFAERERVPVSTLYQWLADQQALRKAPRIVRVIRRRADSGRAASPNAAALILEIGALRVHLGGDFDRPALNGLLDLLEARAGAQR